jgi:hypothetical protein
MADELQDAARRCFMSFKLLEFSPQESTRAVRLKMVPERWTEGYEYSRGVRYLPAWLENDSDSLLAGMTGTRRRINWAAISGLALSLVISGSFWAGIGFLVARVVK